MYGKPGLVRGKNELIPAAVEKNKFSGFAKTSIGGRLGARVRCSLRGWIHLTGAVMPAAGKLEQMQPTGGDLSTILFWRVGWAGDFFCGGDFQIS